MGGLGEKGRVMASETDNAEAAAARLEAALERIARVAEQPAPSVTEAASLRVSEVAARLDGMIARLRTALDRADAEGPENKTLT